MAAKKTTRRRRSAKSSKRKNPAVVVPVSLLRSIYRAGRKGKRVNITAPRAR